MRHRKPTRLAVIAFIVLLVLSVGPFLVTRNMVHEEDHQALQQRADTERTKASTIITQLRSALRPLASALQSNQSNASFTQAANSVLSSNGFAAIALIDMRTSPPHVVESAGSGLSPNTPLSTEVLHMLTNLSVAQPFAIGSSFSSGSQQRLGIAQGPPTAPAGTVIYGEIVLHPFEPNATFGISRDVDVALYAASQPNSSDDLIFSSTKSLPMRGNIVTELVTAPAASGSWTLVTKERRALAAPLSRALPWILLGSGILLAILIGLVIEVISRRRDYALDLVDKRTAELSQSLKDLEETRRIQDALNSELERSNADLAQFAYVASHDLGEPLRSITGFSQLLVEHSAAQLDNEAQEFLKFITDGATRMQELVDGLLEYSRVGTAKGKLQQVDCNDVVADVLQSLAAIVDDSGANVIVEHLPTVIANPVQLSQLFQNLIANAIKFVKSGVQPIIEINAIRHANEWRFSVADNGVGIQPRHRERVFLMFQRLHGRDVYEGTGIGLAVCKKIVERYGGRIWAEDNPDGGSIFFFTIPDQEGESE